MTVRERLDQLTRRTPSVDDRIDEFDLLDAEDKIEILIALLEEKYNV